MILSYIKGLQLASRLPLNALLLCFTHERRIWLFIRIFHGQKTLGLKILIQHGHLTHVAQ